jgi:hypothetical protein
MMALFHSQCPVMYLNTVQSGKFLLLNQCFVGSWLVRVLRAEQKKFEDQREQ